MPSFAQQGFNEGIGAPEYKRGATYLESTLPPAPEAASAVKYVDVPFLHCMGVAQLDIPFYTLKGNELSIPLGLSYFSGGIKLDEIAGVAGLGWTLNAGGCITRTVMDQPDEFSSNGFHHHMPSDTMLEKLIDSDNHDNDKSLYVENISRHHIDAKLDRYSYNVCGLSGTFVIKDDGQVFQLSGDGVRISYSGSQSSGITAFQITGPDGTVYIFSVKEEGTHDGTNNPIPNIMEGLQDRWTATTAWYVSSIISRSGEEEALFSYDDGEEWSRNIHTRTTSKTISTPMADAPTLSYSSNNLNISQSYDTKVLKSITFRGETVSFSYAGFTGNTYHNNTTENNYPVRLTGISVSTLGDREIKRLQLNTAKEENDGRIILNSLIFRGSNGDIYDEWSFSYDTRDSRVSHYAQDWFGFYNGESTGFNDYAPFHYCRQGCPTYGRPVSNEASYMSLNKYNHNGAISTIRYEGNYNSVGVRVRDIIISSGDSLDLANTIFRTFTYENPMADGPTAPSDQMYTTVATPFAESDFGNGRVTWSYTYHETPVMKGPSIRDTRIYYGKVSDIVRSIRITQNNNKIAKTVRYYDTDFSYKYTENVYRHFPSIAEQHLRDNPPYGNNFGFDPFLGIQMEYTDDGPVCAPVLIRQEEYDCDGSDNGRLVSAVNYTYDNPSREQVLVEYAAEQVWHPLGIGGCSLDDLFHYPVYASNCAQRQKIEESHIQYHPDGSRDSVMVTATYLSRGTNLENPSRVSSISMTEGGKTRRTEYTYADESDETYASTLDQQHFLSTPLCTKFFIEVESPFPPIFPLGEQTPWKMECLTFSNFDIATNRLLPSSRIEYTDGNESWREDVLSRDCNGNVQQVKEKGKPNTVILWSYGGKYPIAVIENATIEEISASLVIPHSDGAAFCPIDPIEDLTELPLPNQDQILAVNSLRNTLTGAHVTTFTFEPGIGVTSVTDASGVKTLYEYDFAGRLTAVKDADGNLVKDYEYNLLEDDGDDLLSVLCRVYRSEAADECTADKIWFNTLGLRQQEIAFGASGDGRDLVTIYESDFMLHDDVKIWQPYPANTTAGEYQANAKIYAVGYHGNPTAYFFNRYETSRRDKVLATALPGFVESHENTETCSAATEFPGYKWNGFMITSDSVYDDWVIRKNTFNDADGRSKSEFTDHSGRLVATSVGADSLTYYIYDANDRLKAVVGSGIDISDTLDMWRYRYDSLGRIKAKAVPGSVEENYAYDDEDRIVSIARNDVTEELEYDDFGRISRVFLSNSRVNRQLVEEHFYDVYPDLGICGNLEGYIQNWNGPVMNLETFTRIAQIDEEGEVAGYVMTVYLYDWKARPVRIVTEYTDGGILDENITYNFPGDVVSEVFSYMKDGHTDVYTTTTGYDVRGRKINGTSSLATYGHQTVNVSSTYNYDDLGRPSGCVITSGSNTLSSEDTYTLQDWLASHSVQLNGNVQFGETLSYDTDLSQSYTGLITKKQESHRQGQLLLVSTHEYSYDYAGRLALNILRHNGLLGTGYRYDARGNILSVSRLTTNTFQKREYQGYNYSGDKLVSIDDVVGNLVTPLASFSYDNLGRMTYDGLSNLNMEYNHMDLPRKISSDNTTLVNYSYLADGKKISSLKPSGEGLVYRGPFVYRRLSDGTMALESAACPEGRLTPDKALLYIKDHLGSIRYVIDGNTGARLEKSDYTDYGAHSGSASSAGSNITLRDHFTGQEDQMPDFNIPYSDHGARQYNPGIFRWMVPDPLSEKYYGQSVYNYCGGNPMSFVDRDGKDWYETEIEGGKRYLYTKFKSQEQLDKAEISGRYLGEAVGIFEGRNDETLGADMTITGNGAKPAVVTIFGVNGEEDIKTYKGLTTPCDRSKYNTLGEGEYSARYQDMAHSCYGIAGAKSTSAQALTYFIENTFGKTPKGEKTVMTEIFLHRTDWNGKAGNASHGCLVIDGRQWRSVEKQLGKSQKIHIILIRR